MDFFARVVEVLITKAAMKDSQKSSLSRRRRGLKHVRNCTTTTIPFDLIIKILSLLPAKSLFRFQSVSKLCFSTIRSKSFVDSFLTRSKTRPRLFLHFQHSASKKCFIFSAPEQNHNKSSTVMARYEMPLVEPGYYLNSGSVNGFVCFRGDDFCNTIIVYNPTTRQMVKLPDVTPNGRHMHACLGYDPVEDQYKVLCVMMMLGSERQDTHHEHFVCTVSSSQIKEWRKIENPTGYNYDNVYGETCIDGALYYGVGESRLVRFDVRSEKILFIKTPKKSYISTTYDSTLINYKGKLGGVDYSCAEYSMTLWVLEDAEKQEWSSMKYDLSSRWEYLFKGHVVSEGVIHTEYKKSQDQRTERWSFQTHPWVSGDVVMLSRRCDYVSIGHNEILAHPLHQVLGLRDFGSGPLAIMGIERDTNASVQCRADP
ncbi:unnamed protein product [Eruca vesicaria subsp. sativa]|uniref:F-box domain-containing protein n=1 Tax=Eruca vesicaria subsp. sativa TaxID=29727 RepID=A0ABC8LWX1_ERUVS|nr:unnamed protein product [Eruca vesicaria subsp. sativa]